MMQTLLSGAESKAWLVTHPLGLSIGHKERHDYVSVRTGCFHYTRSPKNLGMIQKRVMAPFIGNVLGLIRVMCGKRDTCLSLSTREYVFVKKKKHTLFPNDPRL